MNKRVRKTPEDEILTRFPIRGKTPGWFFRTDETSAGIYEVEGIDQWGRSVYRRGTEPEPLLEACEFDAARINDAVGKA